MLLGLKRECFQIRCYNGGDCSSSLEVAKVSMARVAKCLDGDEYC